MQSSGRNSLLVMVDLEIEKKNEVFLRVKAEPHIYQELSDHFIYQNCRRLFLGRYLPTRDEAYYYLVKNVDLHKFRFARWNVNSGHCSPTFNKDARS